MKKPKRTFDAEFMNNGVQEMMALNTQARDVAPHAFPPMSRIPMSVPMADEPEILEGHCLKCKGKKKFQVEGKEKTKNGAMRKWGKCMEPGCNTMMSVFTKAEENAAA